MSNISFLLCLIFAVVVFITGYVVRMVTRHICCPLCLAALICSKEEAEKCCCLLSRIAKDGEISSNLLQMLYLSASKLKKFFQPCFVKTLTAFSHQFNLGKNFKFCSETFLSSIQLDISLSKFPTYVLLSKCKPCPISEFIYITLLKQQTQEINEANVCKKLTN